MTRMNWDRARSERAASYGLSAGWLAPPGHVGEQGARTETGRNIAGTAQPANPKPAPADIGDRVTVQFPDGEVETYTLVDRYRQSDGELDVVSPLGWALWDAQEGDTPDCDAPDGPYPVTIIEIAQPDRL